MAANGRADLIIHLIGNTFRLASRGDHDALKKDLKAIYTAPTADAAEFALEEIGISVRLDDRPDTGGRGVRAGRISATVLEAYEDRAIVRAAAAAAEGVAEPVVEVAVEEQPKRRTRKHADVWLPLVGWVGYCSTASPIALRPGVVPGRMHP